RRRPTPRSASVGIIAAAAATAQRNQCSKSGILVNGIYLQMNANKVPGTLIHDVLGTQFRNPVRKWAWLRTISQGTKSAKTTRFARAKGNHSDTLNGFGDMKRKRT